MTAFGQKRLPLVSSAPLIVLLNHPKSFFVTYILENITDKIKCNPIVFVGSVVVDHIREYRRQNHFNWRSHKSS
jgi:hypothetical protein